MDANHAGNIKIRRSHTGVLIYINQAPIIWYSKRQNTVEASSFGSEYIALRICTEMVEALSYKLRCFGVPVEGPAHGDALGLLRYNQRCAELVFVLPTTSNYSEFYFEGITSIQLLFKAF